MMTDGISNYCHHQFSVSDMPKCSFRIMFEWTEPVLDPYPVRKMHYNNILTWLCLFPPMWPSHPTRHKHVIAGWYPTYPSPQLTQQPLVPEPHLTLNQTPSSISPAKTHSSSTTSFNSAAGTLYVHYYPAHLNPAYLASGKCLHYQVTKVNVASNVHYNGHICCPTVCLLTVWPPQNLNMWWDMLCSHHLPDNLNIWKALWWKHN